MKDFVKKYAKNVYSQNGEDGIIEEVIRRIGIVKGTSVEFGAPELTYCSNTANLPVQNFNKFYFDDNPQSAAIFKRFITPENVNEVLPPDCDVLSIDIDGNDFNVWKAYNGKPAIVIIEINSSLDPDVEFFHPDRGASFCTMNRLAQDKGYFLLCHTGNNIYVDLKYKELFPEIHLIVTSHYFFNYSWRPKPEGLQFTTKETRGIVYKP